MTTGNPFSYEKFLWILERDHMFLVDETRFYFNDDADKSEHYLLSESVSETILGWLLRCSGWL